MDIYNDYLSFKENKYDLLEFFIKNNSNIIVRFKHVIAVIDFIYERHCAGVKIDSDEENIFTMGFDYVFERINFIELILSNTFKDNKEEMETFSKTINLLLYIDDFKDEIGINSNNKEILENFNEFENSIMELLENKEHATDVEFGLLNEISMKAFDDLGEEYYGLNEIFYDIALEYGIIDEDSYEGQDVGL